MNHAPRPSELGWAVITGLCAVGVLVCVLAFDLGRLSGLPPADHRGKRDLGRITRLESAAGSLIRLLLK